MKEELFSESVRANIKTVDNTLKVHSKLITKNMYIPYTIPSIRSIPVFTIIGNTRENCCSFLQSYSSFQNILHFLRTKNMSIFRGFKILQDFREGKWGGLSEQGGSSKQRLFCHTFLVQNLRQRVIILKKRAYTIFFQIDLLP